MLLLLLLVLALCRLERNENRLTVCKNNDFRMAAIWMGAFYTFYLPDPRGSSTNLQSSLIGFRHNIINTGKTIFILLLLERPSI